MKKLACLVLVLVFAAACGGSSGSPTPTAPTVSAPTINGSTDLVYIGQTVTFTAAGSGITWGNDAPTVASIDQSSGVVRGLAPGQVTIWAQNSGGRGTRLLRVLPSYNGSWGGSYALIGCQSSGDMTAIRFCGMFYQGQVMNMAFSLSQSRDVVTGSFSLGDLEGTLASGTVGSDGSLPLNGVVKSDSLTLQLQNLRATSPTPGTLSGSFDQVWSIAGASGTGRLACEIRNVTRSSGAPTMRPHRMLGPLTLDDLVRAVTVQR